MSAVDDLMSQIPLDQLAQRLGVDPATAEQATRQALPALLGGMQANASDPAGAASLQKAVGKHDPALVEGGVDLGQVDDADGDKIVSNVFGNKRSEVVQRLGAAPATGSAGQDVIGKLLPLLAPIVMSFLAKQLSGGAAKPGAAGAAGAGGLGGLLGGLLGGGGGAGGQQGAPDLGGLLGGLLGGGKR